MLTNDSMVCNKCGKVFPLFNNDLILQADKYSSGWIHVCKDCLQKKDKIVYITNTNELFNIEDYKKELDSFDK